MSARATVSRLVTASLAPLLRVSGFRKQALTFERRRGDVTQIISFQVSHGGTSFYVNVGLIFESVSALDPDTTGAMVIGKHVVHFGARLHNLAPRLPAAWEASDTRAGDQIRAALEAIMTKLDRIDSARAMLDAFTLDSGFEKVLRAQLKWTIGDRAGARADLEAVARAFSDRQGCDVDALAKRAGLRA